MVLYLLFIVHISIHKILTIPIKIIQTCLTPHAPLSAYYNLYNTLAFWCLLVLIFFCSNLMPVPAFLAYCNLSMMYDIHLSNAKQLPRVYSLSMLPREKRIPFTEFFLQQAYFRSCIAQHVAIFLSSPHLKIKNENTQPSEKD